VFFIIGNQVLNEQKTNKNTSQKQQQAKTKKQKKA
jgi:hypothetical protein